jgi:hypothetical protein
MRTVRTTSGTTAVRVVRVSRRGSREIEHLESAHGEAELEAAAQRRIAAGQLELGLGLEPAGGGPLPITSSRMGHLLDALERACRVLGLAAAADRDDVFRHLVPARVIELVSKLDSLRVLEEAGVTSAWYATVRRRLPEYAQEQGRQRLPAHVPISLPGILDNPPAMSIRRRDLRVACRRRPAASGAGHAP